MRAPKISDHSRSRDGHQHSVEASAILITRLLSDALVGGRVLDVGITHVAFPYLMFVDHTQERQFQLLIAQEPGEWSVTPLAGTESSSSGAKQAVLSSITQQEVVSVKCCAPPALVLTFGNGAVLRLTGMSHLEPWELRETTRDVLDGGLLVVNCGADGNAMWMALPMVTRT